MIELHENEYTELQTNLRSAQDEVIHLQDVINGLQIELEEANQEIERLNGLVGAAAQAKEPATLSIEAAHRASFRRSA